MRLIVRDNAKELAQLFQNLSGVQWATIKGNIGVVIEYDPTKVDSGELITMAVSEGYVIQEAVKETVNLEDVFMSLTKGGIA